MPYRYAKTLLTRAEVIAEVATRAKRLELTKDDTCQLTGVVAEVCNDPYDTLNHLLPEDCLTDANARSDYYYFMACAAGRRL
jgi:hypothetical protein